MTDTPTFPDVTALKQVFVRPAHIDEVDTNALLYVELVDGRPMLTAVHFVAPVDPTKLIGADWPAHVDFAVQVEALYTTTDGTLGQMLNPKLADDARRLARRHQVTDDTLAATVSAYRHHDGRIADVAEELHVSQRTAYRYVNRAREADLL